MPVNIFQAFFRRCPLSPPSHKTEAVKERQRRKTSPDLQEPSLNITRNTVGIVILPIWKAIKTLPCTYRGLAWASGRPCRSLRQSKKYRPVIQPREPRRSAGSLPPTDLAGINTTIPLVLV